MIKAFTIFQENNNNISNPEICDCICMMTFRGAVQCRAYIHSKATVREAINVIKCVNLNKCICDSIKNHIH